MTRLPDFSSLGPPRAFTTVDKINFPQVSAAEYSLTSANTWGVGLPFGRWSADHVACRAMGRFVAHSSGSYCFYSVSDDGIKIFVDNDVVISRDNLHPPTWDHGCITLNAGQIYNLESQWFERTGQIVWRVYWRPAGASGWTLFEADAALPPSAPPPPPPTSPSPFAPPPHPPPSAPPSPPDVRISPTSVFATYPAVITLSGTAIPNGDVVVFLPAGDTTCTGAVQARLDEGDTVIDGEIAIEMPNTGIYKVCLHTDAHTHTQTCTHAYARAGLMTRWAPTA